jgi:DNA-binding SARP family transcriptional activator
MITIRLFGSPDVEWDGSPVKVARRKSRAVLYYLAAHPHPVSRETLLSIFWTDTPRPSAQQSLRTTLHGLRQALGPSLIAGPATVALNDGSQVDARHLKRRSIHCLEILSRSRQLSICTGAISWLISACRTRSFLKIGLSWNGNITAGWPFRGWLH